MKFECKRSTIIFSLAIEYSMHDLICNAISCCASNFAMEKERAYGHIVIKNLKRRNYGYQALFLHEFQFKR